MVQVGKEIRREGEVVVGAYLQASYLRSPYVIGGLLSLIIVNI